MLVKFSSKTYENIIMFENVAKQLIQLMGHSNTIPGSILAEDIPHTLSQLESGLEKTPKTEQQTEEEEPEISLALRAVPLVNMLKAAASHQTNVMWDYN